MAYTTKNNIRATKQIRQDANVNYSLDKELVIDMANKEFNDSLKDVVEFNGRIIELQLIEEDTRYHNPNANFYKVRVRPDWYAIRPAPWDFADCTFDEENNVIEYGDTSLEAALTHPIAVSETPSEMAAGTGRALYQGAIVKCRKQKNDRNYSFSLNSIARNDAVFDKLGVTSPQRSFNNKSSLLLDDIKKQKAKINSTTGDVDITGLSWTGVNNKGKRITSKPNAMIYIGDQFPQFQNKTLYNGVIPEEMLEPLTFRPKIYLANGKITDAPPVTVKVLKDIAGSLRRMDSAFKRDTGAELPVQSIHRPWINQVACRNKYGKGAAIPGYSNHGLAIAIDFKMGSANKPYNKRYSKNLKPGFEGSVFDWLWKNAPTYGWIHPWWAAPRNKGGTNTEPWHWEWKNKHKLFKDAPGATKKLFTGPQKSWSR